MKSGTTKWIIIDSKEQLAEIENESFNKPVVIFKNSTRCGLSQSTLMNFQDGMKQLNQDINFYLLDIIQNRDLSADIAKNFKLNHESPQLMVIQNGTCTYYKNHWNISFMDLIKYIKDIETSNY